jgi:hypothetical protein
VSVKKNHKNILNKSMIDIKVVLVNPLHQISYKNISVMKFKTFLWFSVRGLRLFFHESWRYKKEKKIFAVLSIL